MLRVDGVTVRFDGDAALDDASLEVSSGETVTVLGPSGSGKTTLLRVVAGLQVPDEGRIVLTGRISQAFPRIAAASASSSRITRSSHIATLRRTSGSACACGDDPQAIAKRVRELLELVGLAGFERRSVGTLSGGEQQRVALARALAPEPRLLLLDEPLGSLDRRLRDRLLDDLARLFDELDLTALYVTHDHTEAFTLGDRVAVMRHGRVVQVATPDELWAGPVDDDTARFLGIANVDGTEIVRPEAVAVRQRSGAATERSRPQFEWGRSYAFGWTTGACSRQRWRRSSTHGRETASTSRSTRKASFASDDPQARRRPRVRPGVFFRDSVRRHAVGAGVRGWVRNNRDGTVEAVFEGDAGAVESLVTLCHWGRAGRASTASTSRSRSPRESRASRSASRYQRSQRIESVSARRGFVRRLVTALQPGSGAGTPMVTCATRTMSSGMPNEALSRSASSSGTPDSPAARPSSIAARRMSMSAAPASTNQNGTGHSISWPSTSLSACW